MATKRSLSHGFVTRARQRYPTRVYPKEGYRNVLTGNRTHTFIVLILSVVNKKKMQKARIQNLHIHCSRTFQETKRAQKERFGRN